jgi:hypothetical protein
MVANMEALLNKYKMALIEELDANLSALDKDDIDNLYFDLDSRIDERIQEKVEEYCPRMKAIKTLFEDYFDAWHHRFPDIGIHERSIAEEIRMHLIYDNCSISEKTKGIINKYCEL